MNDPAAFPRAQQIDRFQNVVVEDDPGMSLRDYFAAKAMATLLGTIKPGLTPVHMTFAQGVADRAYEMADAMLRAREKR